LGKTVTNIGIQYIVNVNVKKADLDPRTYAIPVKNVELP